MCHLKGKDHSDAAIRPRQANGTALYRIATVTASATSKATHTSDCSRTCLRKSRSAVAVSVGRIAARGRAASTLLTAVDTDTTVTSKASSCDHLGQRIRSGIRH
jgi:hypothetical protein